MKRDNHPPRILDQIIEMMFPLATLGGFNFDARQLSIQSIDDTKHQCSQDSEPDAAKHKSRSCAASDDEACNRNLVWRDLRFAKKRDQCGFDRRVDVSGQIERALLRRIQNDALSRATILLPRRRKTEWPRVPTHADHVIICLRRIDHVDFTDVDLVFELLKKRRGGRARQEEVPRDQSRPARVLN